MAANRRITELTSPTTIADPYSEQIAKQEQERAIREAELKAQEATNISAEERRLRALYDEKRRQAEIQGQKQLQAGQRAMSFSGLGRSTFNAEQQSSIQQGINNNIAYYNEAEQLAVEKYRAEQQ